MWRRIALLLLFACSSKRERPALDTPRGSAHITSNAPADLDARDILFVPAAITGRLAGSTTVFAMDLSGGKLGPLLAKLPQELGCALDLAKEIGIVVVTGTSALSNAYVTRLPEAATVRCIETLLSSRSVHKTRDHTYEVGTKDDRYIVTWEGDITTVHKAGTTLPSGPAGPKVLTLAGDLPRDAFVFLLDDEDATGRTDGVRIWVRMNGDAFELTMRVRGTAPGNAPQVIHEFLDGIREGAKERQIVLQEAWITEMVDEPAAIVTVRLPLSALR